MNSYHNSTGVRDEKVLAEREVKAESLERRILSIMMKSPYTDFTPSQIWIMLGQDRQLTSVRARITTMTDNEYLIKVNKQRQGLYGVENNCWKWSGKLPPVKGPLWPKVK